jgi:hypothetical protein
MDAAEDDDMDEEDDVIGPGALPGAYARGSRVEIVDLVSRASLNGCVATVLELVSESGRWAIKTDPPRAATLSVRPENIKLVASMGGVIDVQYLLRQLEPKDHHYITRISHEVTNRRIAQRKALNAALRLANGHNAADPLLNDPTCQILELSGLNALAVQPHQLSRWALVSRAWAAAVRAWIASPAALPFWQRVCAGLLPSETVLHPELCTKDMLREWAALPMAVGTKQAWSVPSPTSPDPIPPTSPAPH